MPKSHSQAAAGLTVSIDGKSYVDLCAGLASSLGHGHPAILTATRDACGGYLGSPLDESADDVQPSDSPPFSAFARRVIMASANEANELAIRIARSVFGGDKYRVITLLGSKHGDTFALRCASGRAELQGFDGPVAAGYRHVMPGDQAALSKAIDRQTAAICLSPVDWNRGGEAFDSNYLTSVEKLCRDHDLLLILDETQIPPGVAEHWFFHQRAEIKPDLVTVSAGWFGGLAGGAMFANTGVVQRLSETEDGRADLINFQRSHPLLHAVFDATGRELADTQLLSQVNESAQAWAAMLDEITAGFEFIRSCVHAGLWTTMELDLPAADLARLTLAAGLRVQVSGNTTLLMCPPVSVTGEGLLDALELLRECLESIERETVSS